MRKIKHVGMGTVIAVEWIPDNPDDPSPEDCQWMAAYDMRSVNISQLKCPECGSELLVEDDPEAEKCTGIELHEILLYCKRMFTCGWVGTQFDAKQKGDLE